MKTININGSNYTVEELAKILEDAKKKSPMDKVYEYHKTNEQEFEKLYENIPLNIKYLQKEVMIVAFYNKGEKPDFNNKKQKKWYSWFYLDEFRFHGSGYHGSGTHVPASLCFVGDNAEKNIKEAVVEFFEELKLSRTTLLE